MSSVGKYIVEDAEGNSQNMEFASREEAEKYCEENGLELLGQIAYSIPFDSNLSMEENTRRMDEFIKQLNNPQ